MQRGMLIAAVLIAVVSGAAYADVVLDGSTGVAGALSGPDYAITEDLGSTVGRNLFHSFTSFSLDNTESATFSAVSPIDNVISRVTGGSVSNINGQLNSTIPGANFFFINPAGLVFGPDAILNINGSFYAGSADYVALQDGSRFDAHDLNPVSTLMVAPPAAFGFSSYAPAGVQVGDPNPLQPAGPLLQGAQSETLALIGGDIDIVDGFLYAPDGRVVLASVASPGEVALDPATLSLDAFESLGRISIANPSGSFPPMGLIQVGNLDVSTRIPGATSGGGSIVIRGGDFFLDDGLVHAEVLGSVDGGGIDLKVRGTARMSGNAKMLTRTFALSGAAGPVTIESGNFVMSGRAVISSNSSGPGAGGAITIKADDISLQDDALVQSDVTSSGAGGSVKIAAQSLAMLDNSQVKTSTFSSATGDAGSVSVQAGALRMAGDATINSSTEENSQGRAGSVTVQADTLQMQDDAWIISYTETTQDAGQIDIDAGQMALSDRSVISTSTFSSGNGGTIVVTADNLLLQDAAVITSGTEGSGNAGSVIINAGNLVMQGDAILSSASESGNFFVRGAPDLSSATGGGQGGTVQVNADTATLNGNAAISSATYGSGAGGNVELVLTDLLLNGASRIAATSSGTGNAGDISVTAADSVQLKGGALTTQTLNADGGNITVTADQLVYLLRGVISTSVSGGLGNGGNITIDPVFVVLNSSSIIANAHGGNGGNILIVAENFFSDQNSIIDASSDLGIDGTILIQSPEENVSNSLTEMPEALLSVTSLVDRQCDVLTRKDISSLVMVGQDGLPPSPDDYVAVRVPVTLPGGAARTAGNADARAAHPVIRLGEGYRPGELLILQCNPGLPQVTSKP